jgi:O-antigen/teichoic acid export membrane protein
MARNGCWWLNHLLIVALAPRIARFYNELRLTWLTAVIALCFIIDALNVVQRALFWREHAFSPLTQWKSAAPSHSALLGLAMAIHTIKL